MTGEDSTLEQAVSEQRETLAYAVESAHIVIDLLGDANRQLIGPLADLDVGALTDDQATTVLVECGRTARRLRDSIKFVLLTRADIEMVDTKERPQ